jgi:hypothetical protein
VAGFRLHGELRLGWRGDVVVHHGVSPFARTMGGRKRSRPGLQEQLDQRAAAKKRRNDERAARGPLPVN